MLERDLRINSIVSRISMRTRAPGPGIEREREGNSLLLILRKFWEFDIKDCPEKRFFKGGLLFMERRVVGNIKFGEEVLWLSVTYIRRSSLPEKKKIYFYLEKTVFMEEATSIIQLSSNPIKSAMENS